MILKENTLATCLNPLIPISSITDIWEHDWKNYGNIKIGTFKLENTFDNLTGYMEEW